MFLMYVAIWAASSPNRPRAARRWLGASRRSACPQRGGIGPLSISKERLNEPKREWPRFLPLLPIDVEAVGKLIAPTFLLAAIDLAVRSILVDGMSGAAHG